jgi:hypothetical protein
MQIPELHIKPHVSAGIKNMARLGHIAKGIVYCLAGTLTAMAAFGLGGEKTDQKDVFVFVRDQPFGKVLLLLITAGLACFVVWRVAQAIKDPGHRHDKTSPKRIGARLGYAWSGLIYTGFAVAAAKIALGNGHETDSGGIGSNSQDSVVAGLHKMPFGLFVLYAIALGLAVFGLFQIYRAVSGSFMKNIKQTSVAPVKQTFYKRAGQLGYMARGIVFIVVGFLFYRAVSARRSVKTADTEGVYNFLETIPFGSWLLGLVAIGLVAYGIFMFVRAKYYAVPV